MIDIQLNDRRNECFRNFILDNRQRILNSLGNTKQLSLNLCQVGVFTNEELEKLQCLPSIWMQKLRITELLLQTKFEAIESIIRVLGESHNEDLEFLFDFYKDRILEEYPLETGETETDGPRPLFPKDNEDSVDLGNHGESDPNTVMLPNKVITIDTFVKKCSKCSFLKCFAAASVGDLNVLKTIVDSTSYEKLQPCKACLEKTKGQTLFHAAILAENDWDVLERVEILLKKMYHDIPEYGTGIRREYTVDSLLNQRDYFGQTPIHLAAENERVQVVEKLYYDYHCDILIEDNLGKTPLDLINMHMPQLTWKILNKETLADRRNDGKELVIDFGRIIGCPLLRHRGRYGIHENKAIQDYAEMPTLRKYIESNNNNIEDHNLLSHIIVKLFVDLKWRKMRPFLFTNMSLKVILYLWYTLFIIHIFLAKCPISMRSSEDSTGSERTLSDRTFLTYLFGGWESAVEALTGFNDAPILTHADREKICTIESSWKWHFFIFLIIGFLLTLKEVAEIVLLSKVQHKSQNFVAAYWNNWENRFQIFLNVLMVLIGTLAFQSTIPNYCYSYAAISIVVAWALIFIQVGYLMGEGMYVQLLGKIIKRFGKLMINYLCWIIAFSIALSILLPQEKPFETLPKSFLKVITMMSGELEYENTFYEEHEKEEGSGAEGEVEVGKGIGTNGGPLPSIVFTAHVMYTSVVLLLTIILSNALIGLAVDDVRELQARSEVLLRSIKVDKMYTMEASLLKIQEYLRPSLQTIFNGIFLIEPKDIWNVNGNGMPTGNGMVLKISMKEVPKKLLEEVRQFVLDPENYEYKHNE